jgi:hypothetical protein
MRDAWTNNSLKFFLSDLRINFIDSVAAFVSKSEGQFKKKKIP